MGVTARPQPAVVLLETDVRIPAVAHDFEGFRRWSHSDSFPERGRIDFLRGDIEIDMSPEDLLRHSAVKTAIAVQLSELVVTSGKGYVFIDRSRVASPKALLSVEPDVVVVLYSSLDAGQLLEVPGASGEPGYYVELEGPPDLIVEVISKYSVKKDRQRLPRLYAEAGVRELWLVDARGETPQLEIRELGPSGYVLQPAAAAPRAPARKPAADTRASGWVRSPLLDRRFRLVRRTVPPRHVAYELASTP
jgi:Uma2 family endonuclease